MENHPDSRLTPRQYGFRKNTSTCDALFYVQNFVEEAIDDKDFVVGISLDINNAFNSIKWSEIKKALREKGFPPYLRKIISSYFSERYVKYPTNDGTSTKRSVTTGVPQGSVLGPILWNITYDWVLRTPLERDSTIVGYVDDTLLLTRAHNREDAINSAKLLLSKTLNRIKRLGLSVNESKTNIIVFHRKQRTPNAMDCIQIGNEEVQISDSMKYLGVYLDCRWKFDFHIGYIEEKTQKIIRALSRILPNLRGPGENKRKLYAHTIASVVNYGAPIWSNALLNRKLNGKILRIQRQIAIRTIAGYKTISADAALLVARISPAVLHAAYYRRVYVRIQDLKIGEWSKKKEREIKADEKILLHRQWKTYSQREEAAGKRTCEAIAPNFQNWIDRRHGFMTFRTTQLVTGHGCFYSYLFRIGKVDTPQCPLCDLEPDTAEHTIQVCPYWTDERQLLQEKLGINLDLSRIINQICTSAENWDAFSKFAEDVLIRKEEDERARERARRALIDI